MSIEAIEAVIDLIEIGAVAQSDIVKCLRSALNVEQTQTEANERSEVEPVAAHRVLRKTLEGEWKHDERYWVDGPPSKELVADVAAREGWRIECAYTSPPPVTETHKRQPLTDEQIDALMPEADGTAEANKVWVKTGDFPYCEYDEVDAWSKPLVIQIARAIEAAHGITGEQK